MEFKSVENAESYIESRKRILDLGIDGEVVKHKRIQE